MAHTQIIIWLSTLPLFQPGLIRKGEMKPVAGLQRHPLIYSIFTWEMFPV